MSEPKAVYHARRWSRITADESARIVAMYEDGHLLREIGEAVGRPRESVAAHLERLGLHMRVPQRRPEKTRRAALDWYQRGVRVKVIAAHFKVTTNRVHEWRRAAGIPPRFPKMSARYRRGEDAQ